jgi:transposase InsO family protein
MPKIVVTDNARQFVGNDFANFAHDWNLKHVLSSPYQQQANGKAESAVKIEKNMKKSRI